MTLSDAVGGTPGCPNEECDHNTADATLVNWAAAMAQDVFACPCGTRFTRDDGEPVE